jgi:hypothetical protein
MENENNRVLKENDMNDQEEWLNFISNGGF